MSESAVLSRPVQLADVPAAGLEIEIVANDDELAALAAAYDLVAVKAADRVRDAHARSRRRSVG